MEKNRYGYGWNETINAVILASRFVYTRSAGTTSTEWAKASEASECAARFHERRLRRTVQIAERSRHLQCRDEPDAREPIAAGVRCYMNDAAAAVCRRRSLVARRIALRATASGRCALKYEWRRTRRLSSSRVRSLMAGNQRPSGPCKAARLPYWKRVACQTLSTSQYRGLEDGHCTARFV